MTIYRGEINDKMYQVISDNVCKIINYNNVMRFLNGETKFDIIDIDYYEESVPKALENLMNMSLVKLGIQEKIHDSLGMAYLKAGKVFIGRDKIIELFSNGFTVNYHAYTYSAFDPATIINQGK